jgi:protein SCO1/2/putative membrane protein
MPVQEVIGKDRVPGFEIIHSVNLMLVNDAGRVVGKFDARKDEDMARLRKELKRIAKPRAN